jgi:hypothetical protein
MYKPDQAQIVILQATIDYSIFAQSSGTANKRLSKSIKPSLVRGEAMKRSG